MIIPLPETTSIAGFTFGKFYKFQPRFTMKNFIEINNQTITLPPLSIPINIAKEVHLPLPVTSITRPNTTLLLRLPAREKNASLRFHTVEFGQ